VFLLKMAPYVGVTNCSAILDIFPSLQCSSDPLEGMLFGPQVVPSFALRDKEEERCQAVNQVRHGRSFDQARRHVLNVSPLQIPLAIINGRGSVLTNDAGRPVNFHRKDVETPRKAPFCRKMSYALLYPYSCYIIRCLIVISPILSPKEPSRLFVCTKPMLWTPLSLMPPVSVLSREIP